MRVGVFIERDGILNDVRLANQHPLGPRTIEQLRIREEAIPLLYRLRDIGMVVVATTNQPGLSDGSTSRSELDLVHKRLMATFPINEILVCPHAELDRCSCRKPRPGLLIEAGFKHNLRLDRSFVISDRWQDAEAGRTAGCTSVMIESPWVGHGHRDFQVADLAEAVEKVLHVHAGNHRLIFA